MSKAPICPSCDVQMVERKRKVDGKPFYGCPRFPRCSETANHEDEECCETDPSHPFNPDNDL